MTPEQLKGSILFAALQGKLVEQKENEKTPDLSKIKSKKTEEITFDIPNTWQIAHLECISESVTSKQFQITASEFKAEGRFPVVSQSKEYVIGYCDDETKLYHHDKPIIVFGDHTTIVKYVDFDFVVGADGVKIFEPNTKIITARFFSYVLEYYSTGLEKVGGYSRHYKYVKDKPFPIPPLEEQNRIVSRIEILLPYIDSYAKSYDKLEQFNAKFPEDMKKSILQYAIQGKLVEQRPEEGTAEELYQLIQSEKQKMIKEGIIKKEKPLAEITEEEIPFDIPESWKWVRLGQCGCFERGSGIKKDETSPNGFPCVRYGQLYTTYKIRFSEAVSHVPQEVFDKCKKAYKNDILMALTGENEYDIALAVTYEGTEELAIGGDMTRFFNHCMNPLYLTYVLNSRYGILCKSKLATGNIIVHISNDKLATIPIPLPPLEEQNRIVEKIAELLPYCERLV